MRVKLFILLEIEVKTVEHIGMSMGGYPSQEL
jgi:hypothetical protein